MAFEVLVHADYGEDEEHEEDQHEDVEQHGHRLEQRDDQNTQPLQGVRATVRARVRARVRLGLGLGLGQE